MHTVVVTMWTPTKKNEFGHTLFWVILLVPPLPLCRQPKTHKLFKFLIVMSPLFFVVVSPLLPRGSTSIPSRYQGIVFDNTLYGIFVHIVLVLFVIPQTGACSLFLVVIGAIYPPPLPPPVLLLFFWFPSCYGGGRQMQWTGQLWWTATAKDGGGKAWESLFCLHRFSVAVMDLHWWWTVATATMMVTDAVGSCSSSGSWRRQ